jgi:hypothetical protein
MISLDQGGIPRQEPEFPKQNERFSHHKASLSKLFKAAFPPQSEASVPEDFFVNLRALRGE